MTNKQLLAICSDNIKAVETIQYEKGNQLADRVLDAHKTSEPILLNDLILMENMIRMHPESKPEFLAMKTDFKVENIVMTTDKKTQEELHNQAVVVLELLRDKQVDQEEGDNPVQDENAEEVKETPNNEAQDIQKTVPMHIQKFLKQGRILQVYGEDGVCRSMHFFVSKDLSDIKCKHPKENFIKQKWIIPIHQVKEIKYGYDKKSPIAKSGSFFRRAPAAEKCFAVFGPLLLEGPKNFHVECENAAEAKRWFEYLTYLHSEYKKVLVMNLKRDNRNR